jgi:hypothetical protein
MPLKKRQRLKALSPKPPKPPHRIKQPPYLSLAISTLTKITQEMLALGGGRKGGCRP